MNNIRDNNHKDLLVVLNKGLRSSISYNYENNLDIYTITNPDNFVSYMIQLLNNKNYRDIKIIISIGKISELLPILKCLYLNTNLTRSTYDNLFLNQFNQHLRTGQSSTTTHSIEILPGRGQGDRFIPIDLSIVIDPKEFLTNTNSYLSISSIALQQYLRYFTLKHGARLAVIKQIDYIQFPHKLIDYFQKLQDQPQPIFDSFESTDNTSKNPFTLNLFIPKAWDSWSKIILVSKSMFHDNESLLGNTEVIEEFDLAYNQYIESEQSNDSFQSSIFTSLMQSNNNYNIIIKNNNNNNMHHKNSNNNNVEHSLSLKDILFAS
ncbi:uncharacterized protein RJT21DRAFT_40254 [Scheffersomyces amazonensis]|uniref:uncharacterized protein n=1 Tax=Scheffersomyces amazonensis TaxID=1078765 RepID=UPI00315D9BFC